MSKKLSIGIVGNGFVGSAMVQGFSLHVDQIFIHDKNPKNSTHSLEDVGKNSDIIFVCVPTPMDQNGKADLSIIEEVVDNLSKSHDRPDDQVLVIKSTVVPGTMENLSKKYKKENFVFNPEFLTERNARLDFINSSRIVLGGNRKDSLEKVEQVYRNRFPHTRIIKTDFPTAQLIKYMTNCFFATKVSFMNEMYQVCQKIGGDWNQAVEGFILDGRIGNSHIDVPGHDGDLGFGGKCFPKDLNAMISKVQDLGIEPHVMKGVWEKNKEVRSNRDWLFIEGAVSRRGKK